MMREFGKPNTTAANIAGVRPQPEETPATVRLDACDEGGPVEGLRPFHVEMEEDTQGNNTAKLIGGAVIGLLIIGGGIYAYESSRMPAPQQVALKAPAVNQPALDQTAAAPPAPAPEAMAPDTNTSASADRCSGSQAQSQQGGKGREQSG